MHGTTVVLYWDPLICNNGSYYEQQQHLPDDTTTHYTINGPAPHSFFTQSKPFRSACNHNQNFLKPASLTDTSESENTQNNISQLLKKYSTVYAYSNPTDFIRHLHDISEQYAFDPTADTKTNQFLHNPILLVMVPSQSLQQYALVRFFSFVAFKMPSICVVLADLECAPSYYSCGVQNIFPLTIDADILECITLKSDFLSQQLIKDSIKYKQQQQIPHQRKDCGVHNDTISNSANKELSFEKSSGHIKSFFLALEHFHKATITGTHYNSFLDTASAVNATGISESSYPQVFNLPRARISKVGNLIGSWNFHAHELNNDELLFAAYAMIKHGFTLPAVDNIRITDVALLKFLLILRDSYRPSNPYHNFRHAIDVLQATFYFLLKLNSLPAYPVTEASSSTAATLSTILTPVEALTTLVVAIGHDVAHPGVTNLFLTNSKAPLAEVFEYNSILESYHSAVFTEILNNYWPETQHVPVCKLIVQSVLATDMARHFDYMKEISRFTEKENLPRDEQYRMLVCCLLIKCADISNVARRLDISSRWGIVLSKEFAEVEALELALGLKEKSPASDEKINLHDYVFDNHMPIPVDKLSALAKGQIYFINTFAKPLFTAVSELLPQLQYTLAILKENEATWVSGNFQVVYNKVTTP